MKTDKQTAIPSAGDFPITLDRALRLAVGGRSVPDRFHIFRMWWKLELERMAKIRGTASPDNTDEVVKLFREQGIDSAWLNTIRQGVKDYKASQHSERGRSGAKARWAKAKKELGDSQKRGK